MQEWCEVAAVYEVTGAEIVVVNIDRANRAAWYQGRLAKE